MYPPNRKTQILYRKINHVVICRLYLSILDVTCKLSIYIQWWIVSFSGDPKSEAGKISYDSQFHNSPTSYHRFYSYQNIYR